MRRVAVKFAYDGRGFSGYARQVNTPRTIEGVVVDTLVSKGIIESPKKACFRSASRTDKGVSALGNVIAFNTSYAGDDVLSVINDDVEEVLFYGFKEVDPVFYPRYAKMRVYRYYLDGDYCYDDVVDVLSLFVGEHDFSNFARLEKGKNPVRFVERIHVDKNHGFLVVDFYAQHFLWHQIRRMMQAVILVMNDKISKIDVVKALNNPDIRVNLGLAPAEPLILKDVFYDFEFEYISEVNSFLSDFEYTLVKHLKNKII
ncbi:MAG: tRNA pseudouridine(38-40) synthase TruA [Candidatus Thermoplasmatota archaeon]